MLHLRIVSPPDLTASVLKALAEDPGVTHITADRGGAREPPGDLVSCDIVRASANPLIERLKAAGVSERGGITLTELETVISAAAERAQEQVVTPEIDTVVWEEVAARTSEESTFSVSFGLLMVFAGDHHERSDPDRRSDDVSPDYGPMAALSFTLLIVNLVGLLVGGLLTLLLTRAWARRIEGGRALFRPKSARGI